MTSSFDRIETMILEQENIICPFCSVGYVSENEHRPLVTCAVCDGYASLAQKANMEVEGVLNDLHNIPISVIENMIRKLGPGWYRSEFRTFWRARKNAESMGRVKSG